jgi:nitrogenase molybdenum-iron protein beta chain
MRRIRARFKTTSSYSTTDTYQDLFEYKRQFEGAYSPEKVAEVAEWTKSWEYREKNFAREALTINPAKACQPLGALFVASGFEGTLPYSHGSQGCVAYFRTHLTRNYKEPFQAVSSSMTEDAAVFGGLNNMKQGLENCLHPVQAQDDCPLHHLHGGGDWR